MARGRRPDDGTPPDPPMDARKAISPPTPDEKFEEDAVYDIPGTDQYLSASKLPSGTWILAPEVGRPGRAYKVLPGGTLEVTWESPGYSGWRAETIDDFDKVADEPAWCGDCDKEILPKHGPFCDPEPSSVDEAYEWLLTEKYT